MKTNFDIEDKLKHLKKAYLVPDQYFEEAVFRKVKVSKSKTFFIRKHWGIAASFLLLIGLGVWFVEQRLQQKKSVQTTQVMLSDITSEEAMEYFIDNPDEIPFDEYSEL